MINFILDICKRSGRATTGILQRYVGVDEREEQQQKYSLEGCCYDWMQEDCEYIIMNTFR